MKDIKKFYKNYGESVLKTVNGVVGYLIPCIENEKIVERTFIRSANPLNKMRPFAWLELDSETGTLMFYKHCMHEDFVDTEKYPPNSIISNRFTSERSTKEQLECEKALWDLYSSLREFVFNNDLTEDQKVILKEFKEQWNKTVLCDLKTYYEALSPEFFEWINEI